DWSSDVCSSDLALGGFIAISFLEQKQRNRRACTLTQPVSRFAPPEVWATARRASGFMASELRFNIHRPTQSASWGRAALVPEIHQPDELDIGHPRQLVEHAVRERLIHCDGRERVVPREGDAGLVVAADVEPR